MTKDKSRILWIDDEVEYLSNFVDKIRLNKIDVFTATDSIEADNLFRYQSFDLVITDLYLGPGQPTGIDILRRIRQKNPETRAVVFSSLSGLEEFNSELKDDVIFVSKSDFSTSRQLSDFVQLISHEIKNSDSLKEKFNLNQSNGTDVGAAAFSLRWSEFEALGQAEKEKLVREGSKFALSHLPVSDHDPWFWKLFCGSSKKPVLTAYTLSEVPGPEAVLTIARQYDRVPIGIFREIVVEETGLGGWSGCQLDGTNTHYPTISLEFPGSTMEMHFDTGSPVSFLDWDGIPTDQETAHDAIFSQIAVTFGSVSRSYQGVRVQLSAMLVDQQDGSTRAIHLNGIALKNWDESSFCRRCVRSCENFDEAQRSHGNGRCLRRSGLIGRNILSDNQLAVVLDGANGLTRLHY